MKNLKNNKGFVSVFSVIFVFTVSGFLLSAINLNRSAINFQRKVLRDFEMNQRIADCLFGEFHASACKNLKVIKGSLYLNHEQVFIQLKNKNEHKKVELGLEKKWGLWQLEYWKE